MDKAEAAQFRRDHDDYARYLAKQTRAALAAAYRHQLASQGMTLLGGGPGSKDELTAAIMNLRFPINQLNQSIHVLYHAPGETWSACEWCHPHAGATCECKLGWVTA